MIAVENPITGRGPSFVAIAQAQAMVLILSPIHNDIPIIKLSPSTVKKAITGNGRAEKSEVAAELLARYPEHFDNVDLIPQSQYDRTDALAIGITAWQQNSAAHNPPAEPNPPPPAHTPQ